MSNSCRYKLALVLTFLLLTAGSALAASPQLQEGDSFPELKLNLPSEASQAKYLGLSGHKGPISLSQVQAPYLLVEVFSMYCTICQAEASRMNQVYELLHQQKLDGKIKLVGLGAGNSDYEVGVYRKKYQIAFPLFSDADYTVHKALREPRTPFLLLLKLQPGQAPRVIMAKLGAIGDPAQFLATLKQAAGLK